MGSHLKIMDASGVQGLEADLLDHHSLHEAMEGVDAVYNLASPMPGDGEDFGKVNTEGILNLLEVATEAKVKAFVQLSTLDVYGFGVKDISASSVPRPKDPYQKGKAEAERLLQEFSKRNTSPRVAIIRAARAVGSRDRSLVVPLLRMAESGMVSLPGAGPMSFTHPLDVGQAMYRAASATSPSGSAYLVKSFDATPEELAKGLLAELGSSAEVKKQGRFGGSTLPAYTAEQLKAGVRIGPQESWAELGYSPQFDLKKSCQEIAKWFKKEPWATETD